MEFFFGKIQITLKLKIFVIKNKLTLIYNPRLFQPKLLYSYVIEVADSEYQLPNINLHISALVSEILAFYHLQENALCRPRRCDYVHLTLVTFSPAIILLIFNSAPPMDF